MTGGMNYLILITAHSIDPFCYCPYVNMRLKYNLHENEDTAEMCSQRNPCSCLWSRFLQFFHFVHDSCQSHNGLINSRPSWRQWAGFGLMQALWFGLGLCGLWSAEKNHLFWCAFLLYASHMHVLSAFLREEWTYAAACCVSFCIGRTCCLKLQWTERNRDSILFWQQDWFGHCSSLHLSLSALRSFLLVHNQILSLSSTTVPDSLMAEL